MFETSCHRTIPGSPIQMMIRVEHGVLFPFQLKGFVRIRCMRLSALTARSTNRPKAGVGGRRKLSFFGYEMKGGFISRKMVLEGRADSNLKCNTYREVMCCDGKDLQPPEL